MRCIRHQSEFAEIGFFSASTRSPEVQLILPYVTTFDTARRWLLFAQNQHIEAKSGHFRFESPRIFRLHLSASIAKSSVVCHNLDVTRSDSRGYSVLGETKSVGRAQYEVDWNYRISCGFVGVAWGSAPRVRRTNLDTKRHDFGSKVPFRSLSWNVVKWEMKWEGKFQTIPTVQRRWALSSIKCPFQSSFIGHTIMNSENAFSFSSPIGPDLTDFEQRNTKAFKCPLCQGNILPAGEAILTEISVCFCTELLYITWYTFFANDTSPSD